MQRFTAGNPSFAARFVIFASSCLTSSHRRRRGLSLTELLMASAIMVLIAGSLASLSTTVHTANSFAHGRIVGSQHARVVLDRIEYAIDHAAASEQFPVCLVVTETVGATQLPQTLVIWSPLTTAANPTGLPLVSELAIYVPDPRSPRGWSSFAQQATTTSFRLRPTRPPGARSWRPSRPARRRKRSCSRSGCGPRP